MSESASLQLNLGLGEPRRAAPEGWAAPPPAPLRGVSSAQGPTPSRRVPVFADNMKLPVHRWYRYSAGFSALWAKELVEQAQAARGPVRVLDPFAGSGTTLLAAQQAGAESIGTEAHPFVYRVAAAKLAWRVPPDVLRAEAVAVVRAACEPRGVELPSAEPPALLQKCYGDGVLIALRSIWSVLRARASGQPVDQLLWLALMAILRSTSHVGTAQWQYVLPNKRKVRVPDPFEAYAATCELFAQDIDTQARSVPGASATLYPADARDLRALPAGSIDLVVTSPPYANNYDYADAVRLEMTFEGTVSSWGELASVRNRLMRSCSQHMSGFVLEEALAAPRLQPIVRELTQAVKSLTDLRMSRAGKKAYDSMVAAYFLDMAQVWIELRRVCASGAQLYFVVGDSAPYGVHAPVERWLGELAIAAGFQGFDFQVLRARNDKWKNRKHRVPLQEGILHVKG